MHWDCSSKYEKETIVKSRLQKMRYADIAGLSEMQNTPIELNEAETLSAIKKLVCER